MRVRPILEVWFDNTLMNSVSKVWRKEHDTVIELKESVVLTANSIEEVGENI